MSPFLYEVVYIDCEYNIQSASILHWTRHNIIIKINYSQKLLRHRDRTDFKISYIYVQYVRYIYVYTVCYVSHTIHRALLFICKICIYDVVFRKDLCMYNLVVYQICYGSCIYMIVLRKYHSSFELKLSLALELK